LPFPVLQWKPFSISMPLPSRPFKRPLGPNRPRSGVVQRFPNRDVSNRVRLSCRVYAFEPHCVMARALRVSAVRISKNLGLRPSTLGSSTSHQHLHPCDPMHLSRQLVHTGFCSARRLSYVRFPDALAGREWRIRTAIPVRGRR
jgi:hypothetical protein